jgi:hypothetical protein
LTVESGEGILDVSAGTLDVLGDKEPITLLVTPVR